MTKELFSFKELSSLLSTTGLWHFMYFMTGNFDSILCCYLENFIGIEGPIFFHLKWRTIKIKLAANPFQQCPNRKAWEGKIKLTYKWLSLINYSSRLARKYNKKANGKKGNNSSENYPKGASLNKAKKH